MRRKSNKTENRIINRKKLSASCLPKKIFINMVYTVQIGIIHTAYINIDLYLTLIWLFIIVINKPPLFANSTDPLNLIAYYIHFMISPFVP